jgi:hypothetical protein
MCRITFYVIIIVSGIVRRGITYKISSVHSACAVHPLIIRLSPVGSSMRVPCL